MDVQYSIWTIAGKHNFGCTNLKRKKYCILNKEYSKEEYEALKTQIIADMKTNPYRDPEGRVWSYGEMFPLMMSHFGYNEATGAKFLPKTKEEALAEGYRWYESEQADHATTIAAENLPQKITETPETIVSEIIECMECKRGYKIGQLEYTLIKKMGIPVPHSCPSCRQNARFARLNPPRLWKRECAKCQKEISTAFAPEREETVYCADCYQQEFV